MLIVRSIKWLNQISVKALKGNVHAKEKLEKHGIPWQISKSDPKTWEIFYEPSSEIFYQKITKLENDPLRRGVLYNTQFHFGMNSEHIAPLPVIVTIARFHKYFLILSRDLGPGLGKYLSCIGSSYSTRPWERSLGFGLDDQGNGILVILNQTLNGCQGKVCIESSGQKIILEKKENKIVGHRSFNSKLRGTRFLLFIPIATKWTQEPMGWDPYEHIPSLNICWQQKLKLS